MQQLFRSQSWQISLHLRRNLPRSLCTEKATDFDLSREVKGFVKSQAKLDQFAKQVRQGVLLTKLVSVTLTHTDTVTVSVTNSNTNSVTLCNTNSVSVTQLELHTDLHLLLEYLETYSI